MTAAALFAAIAIGSGSVEFTASATGVEKGTTLEFMFVGESSDRAYEAMFTLDDSVAELSAAIEKCGIQRGSPIDVSRCRMWPVGPAVTLSPPLSDFVDSENPNDRPLAKTVYTGGSRNEKGIPLSGTEMPAAAFAFFNCPQSIIQFADTYPQGDVYGAHRCRVSMNKGERRTFRLSLAAKAPTRINVRFDSTNLVSAISALKDAAEKGDVEAVVSFSPEMTISQATAAANALSVIDSRHVMVNGCPEREFFYRAFLPLVKWRDRQERLVQPFELTVDSDTASLVVIDDDWSGPGDDPKLTPRKIDFANAASEIKKHNGLDTCLVYASPNEHLGVLQKWRDKMPKAIVNWYIFQSSVK